MTSTFQLHARSSKVKAVLGESPPDSESNSFDVQRDMLMNIIHQHFDRSGQQQVDGASASGKHHPRLLASTGDGIGHGSGRNMSVKKGVRHRRRTSLNTHTHVNVTPTAGEPNINKARRVLNINHAETSTQPSPTKSHFHPHITSLLHSKPHTNSHTTSHTTSNTKPKPKYKSASHSHAHPHQTHKHHNIQIYQRPTGPELVSARHPSCSNLPPAWNYIHDCFITYLATHVPLDRKRDDGEYEEYWRTDQIAVLLGERFPRLFGGDGYGSGGGLKKKIRMIENRLALLDEAGNNEYFQMPYGAYMYEEWGRGI